MTMLVRSRDTWARLRTCFAESVETDPGTAVATVAIRSDENASYPAFQHHIVMVPIGYTSNTTGTSLKDHLWIQNAGAANYQANARFFSKVGTGTMSGSAANTWHDCNTSPSWTITVNTIQLSSMAMWLHLREKNSLKVISNVYVQIQAIVEAGGCPDPNMKITLNDGSVCRAGDIEIGMMVLSKHEKTGELGTHKVIKAKRRYATKIRIRFHDKKEVICSDLHRFYLENSDVLIRACKLSKGMKLGDSIVTDIDYVGNGDVIDIEVEDAHTYYMEGLLSHNFK